MIPAGLPKTLLVLIVSLLTVLCFEVSSGLASNGTLDEQTQQYTQEVPGQPENPFRFVRSGSQHTFLTAQDIPLSDIAPDTERLRRGPGIEIQRMLVREGDLSSAQELDPSTPPWGTGRGKSYIIPALEIAGFGFALNGFSRLAFPHDTTDGKRTFGTTPSTIWDNLTHGPWKNDDDAFRTNQLGHPYQGSIYHGIARSTGLGFWESLGYTFAGSALWEIAGETSHPSTNDQVASGIAGSLLGEPLFRIASLILEGREHPGFWRELAATAISPPVGFNRLVFGERFRPVFSSNNVDFFWRFRMGPSFNTYVHQHGESASPRKTDVEGEFQMLYGLPGKPGCYCERPFDFFRLEVTVQNTTHDPIENATTRGLLMGKDYELGSAFRGVWGLYGSYDYLSPHLFRASQTALSVGTNAQWWLSRSIALQLAPLVGVGYGAAADLTAAGRGPYHYGMTAHGFLALRLIFSQVAMLDVLARDLYISRVASTNAPFEGEDNIQRLKVGLTVPIFGRHGLSVQYVASHREAHYSGAEVRHQTIGTIGLFYTLISDKGFGAVEWRHKGER